MSDKLIDAIVMYRKAVEDSNTLIERVGCDLKRQLRESNMVDKTNEQPSLIRDHLESACVSQANMIETLTAMIGHFKDARLYSYACTENRRDSAINTNIRKPAGRIGETDKDSGIESEELKSTVSSHINSTLNQLSTLSEPSEHDESVENLTDRHDDQSSEDNKYVSAAPTTDGGLPRPIHNIPSDKKICDSEPSDNFNNPRDEFANKPYKEKALDEHLAESSNRQDVCRPENECACRIEDEDSVRLPPVDNDTHHLVSSVQGNLVTERANDVTVDGGACAMPPITLCATTDPNQCVKQNTKKSSPRDSDDFTNSIDKDDRKFLEDQSNSVKPRPSQEHLEMVVINIDNDHIGGEMKDDTDA